MPRELLKYFAYDHLKNEQLQEVSQQFAVLADWINANLPETEESTYALRQLLLAKDAAVRAAL